MVVGWSVVKFLAVGVLLLHSYACCSDLEGYPVDGLVCEAVLEGCEGNCLLCESDTVLE